MTQQRSAVRVTVAPTPLLQAAAASDLDTTELPPPPPSRTPQVLTQLRSLCVAVLILLTILAAAQVLQARTDLGSAPVLTDQYARLGRVEVQLIQAENAAGSAVLAKTSTPSTEVDKHLGQAASLLVEATTARPEDGATLATISAAVVTYGTQLQQAATQPDRAQKLLTSAESGLETQLSALDQIRSDLLAQSESASMAIWGWATVFLALLAAAVLVWTGVRLSAIFHRRINLGLAAGVAAALVIGVAGGAAAVIAGSVTNTAGAEQLATVTGLSQAQRELSGAYRLQLRAVIAKEWTESTTASVNTALKAAESDLGDSTELDAAESAFRSSSTQLTTLAAAGRWAKAAALATSEDGPTADLATFTTTADAAVADAVTTATVAPGTASTSLIWLVVLIVIAGPLGAVAAARGINRRLEEYR